MFSGVTTAAHADVWGYIDDKGVAHFAAERVDARYELFFRGGESFDTRDGVKPLESDTPRPVAVPTAPARLLAFFEVSTNYKAIQHILREASAAHNIDYELLQALIATESGFDTLAVSPRGAVGLMQIMPATAERYGVSGGSGSPVQKKLTDPRVNIRAGSHYLGDLIKMFPGRLEVALAAYNAGEGAVQRAGNQIPNYRETQNYVKTVMQIYRSLKPPASVAEQRRSTTAATRVRVQLSGGALGRANMISPLSAAAPAQPEFKIERD